MKYIILILISLPVSAEYKASVGYSYLPDHAEGFIVGIKRDFDRNYITADLACYDKCRPLIGAGKYLVKKKWFYLAFGLELKPSDRIVGTIYQFSTKVGVNAGPCAVEVRHGSNAAALFGQIFGDVVKPNQGSNTIGAVCNWRF